MEEADYRREQGKQQWQANLAEKERIRLEEIAENDRKFREWDRKRKADVDRELETHKIKMEQGDKEKQEIIDQMKLESENAQKEENELLQKLNRLKGLNGAHR